MLFWCRRLSASPRLHQAPVRKPGDPVLFWDLVHQRTFSAAIGLSIVGFGLQVLALLYGTVLLVQPLLVLGLLVYVILAPLLDGRRPDGIVLLGAGLALAGLSGFLLIGRPGGTNPDPDPTMLLPLSIGLAAAVLALSTISVRLASRYRSIPLAVATGICYGVTATLVGSLSSRFADGLPALLGHWQLYAVAVVAPLGVLLSQNAYQAGTYAAPALAIITTLDPLVSIMLGLVWLHGYIVLGAGPITGEISSLVVMIAGISVLSYHTPQAVASRPPADTLPDQAPTSQRAGHSLHE